MLLCDILKDAVECSVTDCPFYNLGHCVDDYATKTAAIEDLQEMQTAITNILAKITKGA